MKNTATAQLDSSPLPFPLHIEEPTPLLRDFDMRRIDSPPSSPRLFRFNLQSSFLAEDREVSIYLPEAYLADPARRFPVLYLHDGQNLYDPLTSYIPGHTWKTHDTADRLTRANEIEPLILVGIANTGIRRMADYTPTEDARMGGGDGRTYGQLLVEELKPFLDNHFRTQPDAASTGLGGSSLGGLISLFLGLRYPRVFGRLAILSPSIWWDQRTILDTVSRYDDPARPRIWLDIGTAEGNRHVRDTQLLHKLLLTKGWRDDINLCFRRFPNAVHTEDAWAQRFDQVLRFLFPPAPPQ